MADATRPADADDSIVNLPGSFPVAAARSGGRIVRESVVHTPRRRETGRPRAAQFAPRAGDGEAFRELAESHRQELQVHCYRMLGSFADAEDAVQETMLAAWQGIGGVTEESASLRPRLDKIDNNRCLNARRAATRRPAREWDLSQFGPPAPTLRDEPVWLQPFPDALLEGAIN